MFNCQNIGPVKPCHHATDFAGCRRQAASPWAGPVQRKSAQVTFD
jgi:hypothetical protein